MRNKIRATCFLLLLLPVTVSADPVTVCQFAGGPGLRVFPIDTEETAVFDGFNQRLYVYDADRLGIGRTRGPDKIYQFECDRFPPAIRRISPP